MMVENFNERKKKILMAIIQEHILTAEPIGSRTLAKKYDLGVSSATIRNEMADLEEMGYLEQPHTSAGRIPSDRGYRYYVDLLLEQKNYNSRRLKTHFKDLSSEKKGIQEIISGMVDMLSSLTKYTVMISEPRLQKSKIRKIEFVNIAGNKLLIVLITDTGLVHNKIIKLEQNLTSKELRYINNYFIEKLEDKELTIFNKNYLKEIEIELINRINLSHEIFKLINNELEELSNPANFKIYLGGTSYILEQPEFSDMETLKKVMNILDQKSILRQLIENASSKGLEVKIGQENKLKEMENCSIVFSTYSVDNRAYGKIGVIGPTRMQYTRVISTLDCVSDILNKIILDVSG